MKINEILQEGLFDKVKQGAQSLARGVQNYKDSRAARQQQKLSTQQQQAQTQLIKNLADKAQIKWAQHQQNLQTAGASVKGANLAGWFTTFSGKRPIVQPAGPKDLSQLTVNQWLTKNIASYLAQQQTATNLNRKPYTKKNKTVVNPKQTQTTPVQKGPPPVTPKQEPLDLPASQLDITDKMPAATSAQPKTQQDIDVKMPVQSTPVTTEPVQTPRKSTKDKISYKDFQAQQAQKNAQAQPQQAAQPTSNEPMFINGQKVNQKNPAYQQFIKQAHNLDNQNKQ